MVITALKHIPDSKLRTVTILGSTGTIGKNTLKLIEEDQKSYQVIAITGNSNVQLLAEQAKKFNVRNAVIADPKLYSELKERLSGTDIKVSAGEEAVIEASKISSDWVISGIVGMAALKPTLAAIKRGAIVALANKECLVAGGELLIEEARRYKSSIIPVDSEHNALFQLLDNRSKDDIERITITASGGPFLNKSIEELNSITPEEAVKHPNWTMGTKISIDSATMMNKGLELIEAYYLFPVEKNQIEIVIHPESIVHGLIHYNDGSVVAGLSNPNMCIPIAYALGWPNRISTKTPRLDLTEIGKLTFIKPNPKRFSSIRIAREVLETGGNAPIIFNASNEVAVKLFLENKIKFKNITTLVEKTLAALTYQSIGNFEEIFSIDEIARDTAKNIAKGL